MRISDWSSDVCSSDLSQPCSTARQAAARLRCKLRFDCCAALRALAQSGPPRRHHAMAARSEEHTSELQSLMRTSYAVFCLKKKNLTTIHLNNNHIHPNNTLSIQTHSKHSSLTL